MIWFFNGLVNDCITAVKKHKSQENAWIRKKTPAFLETFMILAELLQCCHATVEHANRLWRSERFAREQPDLLACRAVQFGFRRLIPLILGAMVGGWHELLAYVEHPERFPWYNAQTDWPYLPPLTEFRPAEDEAEMV